MSESITVNGLNWVIVEIDQLSADEVFIHIKDGDFEGTPFDLFAGSEFSEDYSHVGLFFTNSNGLAAAVAYIWNVDTIEELENADYIEILYFETATKGYGWGTKFISALKDRYSCIGACQPEAEGFWRKMGFETQRVSDVTGDNDVLEWQKGK